MWRERRKLTLNYSAVAQKRLQKLPHYDTTRVAMAAFIVRFMVS